MFDNVLSGCKNTNKVGHITFDFREKNLIKVFWLETDLLLLNLIEEEFDTGYFEPETPEYFYFNVIKYTKFSINLIEEMLKNNNIKYGYFFCDEVTWNNKSYWVRVFSLEGKKPDFDEEALRDLK